MAKVLGVGGVFFRAKDAAAIREWYGRVLGMEFADWGGVVLMPDALAAHPGAATVFSPMSADSTHIEPSHDFMFNLVVDDLGAMLARCKEHGVEPVKLFPEEFNGCFAHILDPEGRKIELWQPKPMEGA